MIPLPLVALGVVGFLRNRDASEVHQNPLTRSPVILDRDRASGCVFEIQMLLNEWENVGAFDVLIAPDGGLREGRLAELKQLGFFNSGASKAQTLTQTPHGRGCAVDWWPVGFNPSLDISEQPEMKERFRTMADFAVARGFESGFYWTKNLVSDGGWDMPHVQVKNWTAYPFPMVNA